MNIQEQEFLQLFLPEGILQWFDVIQGEKNTKEIRIVLEEKNIPPLSPQDRGKKVISKGFKELTITDFPIRGRRALLVFRRRYWKVEGRSELLKRDIQISAPGTELEKEFAAFLKAHGGR